ncbi:3-dehydroquinate synthase [Peptoniphilus harei]|uniref:3-dehydroquinate synthase n=1 Tax=Peptoniphilus TaxID=162289 RepID=UPI0025503871|nr:3-dehydroquinate synthase [Peptoniphilus harei]MDK7376665.1 3-dehydroquinate synthase [Peptoniphilus harei]MDK7679283.1 3-dehydroquinate synthase [Peptoniphilus harei]
MEILVKENNYKIDIDYKNDDKLKDFLRGRSESKFLIITDENVFSLYEDRIKSIMKGLEYFIFKITPGEKSKSIENFVEINKFLVENNFNRGDAIIAFGGGVVGDLGGYVAASYLRGIDFLAVPTTLLSMIDSSVGGKNGINFMNLKNQVGSFYFPKYVHIDYSFLETLDERNINNGLAEIFKYSVLKDRELFEYLKSADDLDYEMIIYKSLNIKLDFVRDDERDRGKRQKLNLGHTIGHGIESLSNYQLNHGESIGIGTIYMARAAYKLGLAEDDFYKDLIEAFENHNLPISYDFDTDEILEVLRHDKKIKNNKINIIIPTKIGEVMSKKIDFNELREITELGKND